MKVLLRPSRERSSADLLAETPTYKTQSKGKVHAMVRGRRLCLSRFEDGSRGGVVSEIGQQVDLVDESRNRVEESVVQGPPTAQLVRRIYQDHTSVWLVPPFKPPFNELRNRLPREPRTRRFDQGSSLQNQRDETKCKARSKLIA
jgi:hypothetical protein